eukprot:gene18869-20769_t
MESAARRNTPVTASESPQKRTEQTTLSTTDSHNVSKRLRQDLMTLMTSSLKTISAFPNGDNLFQWNATIQGCPETPYEGIVYKLSLEFPARYPIDPPNVKFISPCFHPNIDEKGNICLDILKEKWSPLLDAKTILLSIQSLLGEPNNDSPLNSYAASLWSNQAEYRLVVRKRDGKNSQQKPK